MSKTLVRVLYL